MNFHQLALIGVCIDVREAVHVGVVLGVKSSPVKGFSSLRVLA